MTDSALKVLKAGDVTHARQAATVRATEELAAETARQDALAAAYAAGFDDGRSRALAEGAAAAPRIAAALEELARTAAAQRAAAVDASSRAVLATAMDIAEWVLRHELGTGSRSLLARLDEALHALLPGPTLRATVSPADEDAVRPWAQAHGVALQVDPQLGPGDAHFDNGTGSVEVTVAAALRIAAEALGVDPARGPQ